MLNDLNQQYERSVLEEDEPFRRIRTCTKLEETVIDFIFDSDEPPTRNIAEQSLLYVGGLENILRLELLKVQTEKKLLARQIREARSSALTQ